MGDALLFLTHEWKVRAADAWLVLNPHSRAAANDSAGAQGRRLKAARRKQIPLYRPRHGHELRAALNLLVLVALHRLRQADARDPGRRLPHYTGRHRRLHRALNLILLGRLHGMNRAQAWRAMNPWSRASDESAAAEARREISWYRKLHMRALDPLARSEPDAPDGLAGFPSWLWPTPAVEPLASWYARMLQEQAEREVPETWLAEADAIVAQQEEAALRASKSAEAGRLAPGP